MYQHRKQKQTAMKTTHLYILARCGHALTNMKNHSTRKKLRKQCLAVRTHLVYVIYGFNVVEEFYSFLISSVHALRYVPMLRSIDT
jgi:hypothetical protein